MTTSRIRRIALVAAAGILGSTALVGCSSDSDNAASTPSASPTTSSAAPSPSGTSQVCTDAATAKASLQSVVSMDVLTEGTAALKSNFATFKTDAEALIASAQTQFAPETEAVKTSISNLESAINALADSPSVAEVAALAPALASIKTSTQTLFDAVDAAC